MTTPPTPLLIYQTEDWRICIAAQVQADTLWLTQQQMAQLFQTTKQNISLHLQNVIAEGELAEEAVVKNFLITASDGKNYRHLRHQHRLRPHSAAKHFVFSNGAKQTALGHHRANGGRNHPQPRRQNQASNGFDDLERQRPRRQYDQFNLERVRAADAIESDFDRAMAVLPVASPAQPQTSQHLNAKTNTPHKNDL